MISGHPGRSAENAEIKHACRCTFHQIQRYKSKISGPLMDRINIHVEVPAVPYKDLRGDSKAGPSAQTIALSVFVNVHEVLEKSRNGLIKKERKLSILPKLVFPIILDILFCRTPM